MSDSEEPQREITRVALRSLDGTSFVLAGSGAMREHGLVDRPTEDVDLFTSDVDLARFSSAVDAVVLGLREAGHDVAELRRVDQFARLEVTTADGHQVDIDMGVDWREAEPAVLAIGPVLSLADAVGNKLSALYSRAGCAGHRPRTQSRGRRRQQAQRALQPRRLCWPSAPYSVSRTP